MTAQKSCARWLGEYFSGKYPNLPGKTADWWNGDGGRLMAARMWKEAATQNKVPEGVAEWWDGLSQHERVSLTRIPRWLKKARLPV